MNSARTGGSTPTSFAAYPEHGSYVFANVVGDGEVLERAAEVLRDDNTHDIAI